MPQAGSTSSDARPLAQLDSTTAFHWLRLGWRDLWIQPASSFIYGVLVFVISWIVIASLFSLDLSAYLFPALAGFFIVGPIMALGLYEKSRSIENGETLRLSSMFLLRAESSERVLRSPLRDLAGSALRHSR